MKGDPVLVVDLLTSRTHLSPDNHRPFSHTAEDTLRALSGNAATSQQPWTTGLDAAAMLPTISDDTTSTPAEPDHSVVSNRHLRRINSTDSLSTASSSEAPTTPRNQSPLLGHDQPTLVDLEHRSHFRSPSVCVACRRSGANFPSCPRCGETWCSRGCRLKSSNGTRHHC